MKRFFLVSILCLFMVFSTFGCSRNISNNKKAFSKNPNESKVIKVVSASPLSGNNSVLGEGIKNGAQMAVEERKSEFKTSGYNLQFEPYDDQAEAKVGVTLAQKMLNEKDILAVVGHLYSGVTLPASEIYNKDNLLMISPSNTAVKITDRGMKCVNRLVARDDQQGPIAAKFSIEDLKAKKIFIINDGTDYGKGIAEEYKKAVENLNAEIVGFEGIAVKESDFSGVLAKVTSKNPDLVFFGGVCPEAPIIIRQMKEKNINIKFLGPDGLDTSDTAKIAGDSVIGVYYTSTASNVSNTEKGRKWAGEYENKFNKKPESYSAYGYDSMNVALNAIKQAINNNLGGKPSRSQVTNEARKLSMYDGIATKVEFDEKGDNKDAAIFVYKYNKVQYPGDLVKSISAKEYKITK